MGYRMPAEWERHTRTWMSYPPPGGYVATLDPDARESWLVTANTVSEFEPVRLLVDSSDVAHVTDRVSAGVDVIEAELDDGWVRDNGPTFVVDEESSGLAAVHWTFNAWGAMAKSWEKDARLGGWIAGLADVPVLPSEMVNEGGGICVDGEGTVIITETVQLHDRRNPGWSKAEVEQRTGSHDRGNHRHLARTRAHG